ncbi:hypothetical protein CCH79_00002056 [Gambusia affinis]|uniref:Dicarboxylate carrier UCP2 n=1 Tax=Gambusia affinis TaxID=33528 RepID=A0A315VHM8_GAMAF|nr:hypothetical protein CCH79_00002056 [Gambusia affinis]
MAPPILCPIIMIGGGFSPYIYDGSSVHQTHGKHGPGQRGVAASMEQQQHRTAGAAAVKSENVLGEIKMVAVKPTDLMPSASIKFFGAGTAACIADLITFPLDTAKVRLQIQGESQKVEGSGVVKYRGVFGTINTMVRTEGARSLYNGLVAGLQRQMSFASVRIGLYDSMKQFYTRGTESAGIVTRLMAGCTTGAMAVAFAQPTDVVKVRFQAQVRMADGERRYNSTLDAYKTIARDEGVRGLWRGCMPNITRNAIVNCAELVTYDMIKELILKYDLMTDNLPCHFTAAFGAGFCTTVVASPVDVVKTRFMNSGNGQYASAINCTLMMLRNEGPGAFYKGFMPSFLRLGSWNIVMFVTYEQIKRVDVPPTAAVKFVGAGTAACIADLLTFPLDTAKVRLQVQGETSISEAMGKVPAVKYRGVFGTIITMVRTEGPLSLYSGLVAGLQRQMSFASIRIGLYDSVKQFYTKGSDHVSIGSRLLAGCTTGGMAVALAQPTDVVKVRFQAQARSNEYARRYCGTIDAYKTIAKEEGIRGLWKGTGPNIARNAIVNCTELVTYDFMKDFLLTSTPLSDNLPCHFVSAFGAGLCTTVIASPVDVVKTRYMNSALGRYSNALNCAAAMMAKEGPLAFYKGFMPSFLRLGSWNVVMFVTYEQLKRALMAANHSRTALL